MHCTISAIFRGQYWLCPAQECSCCDTLKEAEVSSLDDLDAFIASKGGPCGIVSEKAIKFELSPSKIILKQYNGSHGGHLSGMIVPLQPICGSPKIRTAACVGVWEEPRRWRDADRTTRFENGSIRM